MAYSDRDLLARLIQCEAGGEGENGMKAAGPFAAFFLRLIQTHQHQGEQRHIVTKAATAQIGAAGTNAAADSAVNGGIAILLRRCQLLKIRCHKTKHSIPSILFH